MQTVTEERVELKYSREGHSRLSISLLKIWNVFCFVSFVTVSALMVKHLWGRYYLYEGYDVLFRVAKWGYVVEILLTLLQGIFVIYQALPIRSFHLDFYLYKLNLFLGLSWLFLTGAMLCFAYKVFWASLVFLLAGIISGLVAYFRLQTAPLRLMPLLFNNHYYWTERYHITHRYGGIAQRDIIVEENEVVVTFGEKFRGFSHYFLIFVPTAMQVAWTVFILAFAMQVVFPGTRSNGWSITFIIILGLLAIVHNYWQSDIWYPFTIVWGFIALIVAHRADAAASVITTTYVMLGLVFVLWLLHCAALQPYWTFFLDRRNPERTERAPLISP